MTTPEERLCSRSWRLRNSAWLLWPALSLGLLTSVGVLRIGLKTKQRSWLLFAAAYGAWTVCFFVSSSFVEPGTKENPSDSVGSNILYSATFILWLVGMVHCFFLNRSWLRWRAANPKGQTAWYASGVAAPAPSASSPPQPAQDPADTLSGLYRDASTASRQVTTPVDLKAASVDLNTADSAELAAVGIDNVWAERIVAARARLGGFSATDQLMTEAGVPPHVYAAIRGRVQVAPTPSAPRSAPPSGGRRLDF
jgi:hypothetical protein